MLKHLDRWILERALKHPNIILAAAVTLLVSSLALVPFMGRDFLPQFNEGTAVVSVLAPPGISLKESNEIGTAAEKIILKNPAIKSVSRRTGRAELDEHAMSVNVSEIDVDFKNGGKNQSAALDEIRDAISDGIPGVNVNIGQPIGHLIDHMLSGVNAAIAIKVFGTDLQVLRETASDLKEALEDTKGLVDLRIETQGRIPQLKIKVLREEAARFGLSAGEVTSLLEAAYNGETVAQVIDGTKLYDIFYRLDDDSRASKEKMQKTVLKTMPDGRKVLLEQVADVYEASGPNEIFREQGQRRIIISANASNRDLGSLITEIKNRVETKVELPAGYYVTYGGRFESQESAAKKLLSFGLLALLAIAAVLYQYFQSKRIAAQVLLTIPLAFIGGIFLLFATDRTITVASLVGFITLCGIASRNSIMMISHYLHLMRFEKEKFSREMIIRGSQERLAPVLMTASVASLALLPLVFAKGQPGSEILHPVAVVIVGGLITSTLLDIIVTPTLFFRFGRLAAEEHAEKVEIADPLAKGSNS